jgi:predicted transcriptional regulator
MAAIQARLIQTAPSFDGPAMALGNALSLAQHLSASASRDYNVRASHVQGFLEMPKTTFTFRVDQRLKEAFTEATRANDRPGSQLLRDFMRDYVERAEHDAWFRAEVEQSLREADDPNVELIPHEEVVRMLKARRAGLIERAKRKRQR